MRWNLDCAVVAVALVLSILSVSRVAVAGSLNGVPSLLADGQRMESTTQAPTTAAQH